MGVMDEKTPIGGSSTQMPQSPTQTPNWFVQALRQLGMGGGQVPQMTSMPRPAGMISPAITPLANPSQAQAAPPVTAPQGGQAPRIPQLPQVNSTAANFQGPSAPLPISGGPVEFSTKGGRDAAIIKGSVDNILGTLHQYKVDQFQKQAAEAEQIWGNYLSLNSAAENEQDPQKKQQLQQLAQQMIQDKKVAKVLEKAHKDPMSGPGVGLQRAIQGSSQRAMAQAQLEHVYAQMAAEQQRAQQEFATANLRNVQASQEGQVTPKDVFNRETELQKFRAQQAQKGYSLEVRGMTPTVKGPDGATWSWEDLNDPARAKLVPPDAARTLMAERQSVQQGIAEQEKKQAQGFANSMARLQQTYENAQTMPAIKLYHDTAANTLNNDMRYARMQNNMQKALNGDQQAMVSLLSDHVAMTLRQPGRNVQRPTLQQWKEAEQSSDLLSRLKARFDDRGMLAGTVLTPEQMQQMVHLAQQQHKIDWVTTYTAYKNSGLDPKKVPLPQTLPGLEVIPPDTKAVESGPTSGTGTQLSPDDQKILDLLNKK